MQEPQNRAEVNCGLQLANGLLFLLPGELRNRIYRLALLEPTPIPITSTSHAQPGLLRTGRQLRYETLKIFCEENEFNIEINSLCCGITLRHWICSCNHKWSRRFVYTGTWRWSNLAKWIEGWHSGVLIRPSSSSDYRGQGVELVFDIMEDELQLSWPKARQRLDELKLIAMRHPSVFDWS